MRTMEVRRGRRINIFIIAAIAATILGVCLSATVTHAANVTVRVFSPPSATTPLVTCGPVTSTGSTVTIPSCGQFQVTPQSGGTAAQVAALPGNTENQLVVRTAVIKNAGASTARFQIEGTHIFTLPGNGTDVFHSRYYGAGLSASFSRAGGLLLACSDSYSKKGYYAYFIGGGTSNFVEDQIGGGVGAGTSLSYIVPCSGSTTQNTIPTPAPSTSEGPRICSQLVANNNCTPLQERLRTLVDVTLAAGDQVTIPNGDHDFAGNSQNEVQASLNTLTAQLLLQQNNQNSNVVTINPFDSGYLTVILVCNESFACKDVDPNSLSFGPNGAFPVSTKLGDFNKDGIDDLFIKVRQPDTGITCSDTAATLSGNVTITVGSNTYPLPFHSTIGFAISSSGCP